MYRTALETAHELFICIFMNSLREVMRILWHRNCIEGNSLLFESTNRYL